MCGLKILNELYFFNFLPQKIRTRIVIIWFEIFIVKVFLWHFCLLLLFQEIILDKNPYPKVIEVLKCFSHLSLIIRLFLDDRQTGTKTLTFYTTVENAHTQKSSFFSIYIIDCIPVSLQSIKTFLSQI
jgi:hypothetical protein